MPANRAKRSKQSGPFRNARRPLQQRALARVESILAATEALLTEGDYNSLTMLAIAERAGITATSIYQYFGSVEEILVHLVEQSLLSFREAVQQRLELANTPAELIDALLGSLAEGFEQYQNVPSVRGIWVATRYLPTLRELDRRDTLKHAANFMRRLRKLDPGFKATDAHQTVLMIVSLVAPFYDLVLHQPASRRPQMLETYVDMSRRQLDSVILGPLTPRSANPAAPH